MRASKDYVYLLNNLQWAATISHSVSMPKLVKVVPITIAKRLGEGKGRVFGVESESHRVIFGIAERRFAFDILVSVTDPLRANIDETESAAIITEQGGQENHRERNQDGSSFCSQFA